MGDLVGIGENRRLTIGAESNNISEMKTKPRIGDEVDVTPKKNDVFQCEFTGTVRGFRGTYVRVEDQESHVWDCDLDQIEPRID
jgi:hypothetical protein